MFTATLMVAEVVSADGLAQRVLRWRPLSEVGKLSYGMYLIHFLPALVGHSVATRLPWAGARPWVALAVAAGGSIAVAWVLAVTVERPFIRLGRKWSARLMQTDRPPVRKLEGRETPATCERIGIPA
jgi:peptidoglycan/LPS O-acetylase OafA/YrhL